MRSNLAVNQRVLFTGWNARGVEYDPRDWNYWIGIMQSPNNSIVKIKGFYDKPSGIETGPSSSLIPTEFALGQSYPNPMNKGATFRYQLPFDSKVSLKIYNIQGQLVRTLFSGDEKAGYKSVFWDGRNLSGRMVSAGIYFYRLDAGNFSSVKKMVVLR